MRSVAADGELRDSTDIAPAALSSKTARHQGRRAQRSEKHGTKLWREQVQCQRSQRNITLADWQLLAANERQPGNATMRGAAAQRSHSRAFAARSQSCVFSVFVSPSRFPRPLFRFGVQINMCNRLRLLA